MVRYEDALVQGALERDMNRDAIADLLGFSRRTTFYKEKRAYAYDFPLKAFQSGRRGWTGSDDSGEGEHDVEMAEEREENQEVGQTAADEEDDDAAPSVDADDLGEVQVWSTPDTDDSATVAELLDDADAAAEDVVSDDVTAAETHLERAISALQAAKSER